MTLDQEENISIGTTPNWENDGIRDEPYNDIIQRVQGADYDNIHGKNCLQFDDELYPTSWHLVCVLCEPCYL